MKNIHIRPRYFNRYTDPDSEQNEKDCRHAELDWQLPLNRTALVCLDIWNTDLHRDMQERDDRVTREKIVPLVKACRARGLRLVHAPAPPIARRHPNWVDLLKDETSRTEFPDSPDWPPADFHKKTGDFASYAQPEEPDMKKAWQMLEKADFHVLVKPEGDEPVIATGEELHRLCAREGILFLLFAGFHTPGCMTGRTYGLVRMRTRGYACILLRDCTNGMETHETFDDQTSMKGTIAFLEQTGIVTLNSEQLIEALKD